MASSLTHAQLVDLILAEARARHLFCYHNPDSRRVKGTPGFPDLFVAGPCGAFWAEIKIGQDSLSPDQRRWRNILWRNGMDVRLWREADWPGRICRQLDEIAA